MYIYAIINNLVFIYINISIVITICSKILYEYIIYNVLYSIIYIDKDILYIQFINVYIMYKYIDIFILIVCY